MQSTIFDENEEVEHRVSWRIRHLRKKDICPYLGHNWRGEGMVFRGEGSAKIYRQTQCSHIMRLLFLFKEFRRV
jgi:hypothetical protein